MNNIRKTKLIPVNIYLFYLLNKKFPISPTKKKNKNKTRILKIFIK